MLIESVSLILAWGSGGGVEKSISITLGRSPGVTLDILLLVFPVQDEMETRTLCRGLATIWSRMKVGRKVWEGLSSGKDPMEISSSSLKSTLSVCRTLSRNESVMCEWGV